MALAALFIAIELVIGGDLPVWEVVRIGGPTRTKAVVTLGAAFPPGRFDDGEVMPVIFCRSRRLDPQVEVLRRHDDGSVHLVRFSLLLDGREGKPQKLRLALVSREESESKIPFSVLETGAGLRISNGLVRLVVPPDPAVALQDLRLGRSAAPALQELRLGKASGEAQVEVETRGAHRLVVLQSGRVLDVSEGGEVAMRRRITLDRGSAAVVVETWLDADGPTLPRTGFGYALKLPAAPRRLFAGAEPIEVARLVAGIEIDRFGRGDAELIEGLREGLVLKFRQRTMAIEIEDLRERGPATIRLDDDVLHLPCVDDGYRWRAGRRASRRLRIALENGGRRHPKPAGRFLVRRLEDEASPSGKGKELREILVRALEPDARLKSGFDWRGELNWGDWRWSRMDAGNLEYDTIHGLRRMAGRLERPRLLLRSRAALQHFLRVDLAENGVPFRHGPGHVGGVEAGHMWLEGAIEEALADGDPFLVEGLLEVVEAWKGGLKRFRADHALCRSLAWSIVLASALARDLHEPDMREGLSKLYFAVSEAPGGAVPLFDRLPKRNSDIDGYLVSPWVTIGLLGEALHQAQDAPGLEAARARWRGAVRALAPLVWDERAEWPKARFSYDMDGELIRSGGRMEGEEALFLALGLKRLGEFEELQTRCIRWGLDHLRVTTKHFNGIELSQLMWLEPRLFP